MAKIFSDDASVNDILEEVKVNGIAGICGGRLAVRAKMSEVRNHLNEDSDIDALSTYDHQDTELGSIFDSKVYDRTDARNEITSCYDKSM